MTNELQAHQTTMDASFLARENMASLLIRATDGQYTEAGFSDSEIAELESLGVDISDPTDTETIAESARDAIYADVLSVETRIKVDVMLAIGGPTQYLSAWCDRGEHGQLERISSVSYHDSWAVPSVWELGGNCLALCQFYDMALETQTLD